MKAPKNDRINTRLPAHLRLGAELLAGKHGVSLSVIMERALAEFLKREGLTEVPENEIVSLLDRITPLSSGARILEISKHRPDLLSPADRVWIGQLEEEERKAGRPLNPDEIERFYESEWGAWS